MLELENQRFVYNGKIWCILNLIEEAKKLKPFKIPLKCLDLNCSTFSELNDVSDFAEHYKNVEQADLKYPIILGDKGEIMDGRHRLCKAIIKYGIDGYILAVRFKKTPSPDCYK